MNIPEVEESEGKQRTYSRNNRMKFPNPEEV